MPRWTTVQNLMPLALSSADKSVTVQNYKQTVNNISTPCLSACVDKCCDICFKIVTLCWHFYKVLDVIHMSACIGCLLLLIRVNSTAVSRMSSFKTCLSILMICAFRGWHSLLSSEYCFVFVKLFYSLITACTVMLWVGRASTSSYTVSRYSHP